MAGNTSNGVTFVLKSDAAGVKPGVDEAKASFDGLAKSAQDAGKKANDSLDSTSTHAKAMADAMEQAQQRSARAAAATNSSIGAQGDALAKLIGKIDPTVAALGKLDAQQAALNKFKLSGALGADDFAVYAAKLNATRDALTSAGDAASHLSFGSAAAKREVGVLAAEMARGDFTKFQGSLLTLANRTGALTTLLSPLGIAIGAVAAAAGVLVVAFVQGENEINSFNKALIATGGYAQLSAGQLAQQVSVIGAATGKYSDAEEALTKLVSSGKFAGASLEQAAQGAVNFSVITGQSIDKAVDTFTKLADDPAKESAKLNESLHYLTESTYAQIAALEQMGDKTGAAKLAFDALADATTDRAGQYKQTLTGFAGLWNDVKSSIDGAWNSTKNFMNTGGGLATTASGLSAFLPPGVGAAIAAYGNHQQLQKPNFGAVGGGSDSTAGLPEDNKDLQASMIAVDQESAKYNEALQKSIDSLHQTKVAETEAGIARQLNAGALMNLSTPALIAYTNHVLDQGEVSLAAAKKVDALNDAYKNRNQGNKDAQAALDLANAERTALNMVDSLAGGLNDTAKAQATFDDGTRNLEKTMTAWAIAGGDVNTIIALWQQGETSLTANLARTNAEIAKRNALSNGNKDLNKQLQNQRAQLAGLTPAQVAYNKAVDDSNELATDALAKGQSAQTVADGLIARLKLLADIRDNAPVVSLVEQFGQKSDFDILLDNIDKLKAKLATLGEGEPFEPTQRALDKLNASLEQRNISLLQEGVSSVQKFAKEGTAAYTALGIAQDILAYKSAVAAIATQGEGDPYSAFARIAAMIALMASIGIRVAGSGSSAPSSQSAEVMQKTQGTGSVLGDATAQSESIAKAVAITADATTQLVGLNRGMLNALVALQSALGAAGNQLARGAGNVSLPGGKDSNYGLLGPVGVANPLLNAMTSDPIGSAIGGFLFGGDQEVIDKGIQIVGGKLKDMLNGIVVGAYNTIQTDGGLFGSDSTDTNFSEVGGEFAKQFQLVIGSIVDTVRQGALALGLLPADIDKAINDFEIATTKISLEGLSADDQQKAIEAVFSQIFDGLAGAVVPFIGQFQLVGEGLGETLVRVATEVQVAQEAFKELGISVNETDPEKFAQIADGLVTAAGGLDAFITSMQSFVDKFAPDSDKFKLDFESLTSGLGQVGLTLPSTRDGMYALMQSLDATTASGREQIATLLKLTDTSDAYYSGLEKQATSATSYSDFIAGLVGDSGKISSFAQSRIQIEQWERDTIKQANALAKAAGLQGASEQDLTLIHEVAAHKIADAIAELQSATQDLVDKLYHGGHSVTDSADSATAAVGGFGNAMTSVAEAAKAAAELLLGDLSPLNDTQKLQYALTAFNRGLISKTDVLDVGHRLYGSSQPYVDLFNSLANRADPSTGGGGGGGGSAGGSATPQESAAQRHDDANTIAENLASLANAQHESYADVATSLHLNLSDLAKDLNLSDADLTKYLDNLTAQENAIPDSLDGNTNRIIAALYDIAGLPPPVDPVNDGGTTLNGVHGGRGGSATTFGTNGDGSTSIVVPQGHSGHARPVIQTSAASSDSDTAAQIRGLRSDVNHLATVMTAGNGQIVDAVNKVETATDGVGTVISRGNAQAAATSPRGRRT